MTLSQIRLRIGAVVAALGLAAINVDSILTPIITGLGLPPSILTLPTPVKIAVVILAAVYALIVAQKASEHNPDGTPAEKPYDAGKEVL